MSKVIKVHVTCKLELPDSAEIIRIETDDGVPQEFLRIAGRLVMPDVMWMEYLNGKRMEDDAVSKSVGIRCPMGFESVDDDFQERFLMPTEFGDYYLEEEGREERK